MEREKMYQKIIEESQQRIREQDDIIKSLEITVDGQDEASKALREQIQVNQKKIKEERNQHLQLKSEKETLSKKLEQLSRDFKRQQLIEQNHIQDVIRTEKRMRNVMGIAWWAILLLHVVKTEVIMTDFQEIGILIIQTILFFFKMGKQLFLILDQRQTIHSEIGALICQWIATIIVAGFIVGVSGLLITKCLRFLYSLYRTFIWDEITRVIWYLNLAIVVIFAEELVETVPVNVIIVLAGMHGIYIIVRVIMRKKDARL